MRWQLETEDLLEKEDNQIATQHSLFT
jgi:hypothetical protein